MRIQLCQVTKSFGTNTVLRNLDLEVKEGEFFFILGPSGCGKTTLLRMIAGFESPTAGDILFDGRSVVNDKPNQRNIGMVFQNYALWPHLNVRENVRFGLDIRKVPRAEAGQQVREVLEMVHLGGFEDRFPNQLSGGQQQRVALARALVTRPGVLLLDEPLSNLDARLRLEMRDELLRVHKATGITTVYVTHDQKEALSMADRMILLKDGIIMQEGHPFDVYRRPRSRFTAGFMGETNFLPGEVQDVTDDRVRVQTPLGLTIGLVRSLSFTAGEKITVSIRPEAIQLMRSGFDNPGLIFGAMVEKHIFMGEFEHFWIRSGESLLKMLLIHPRPGIHKAGTGLELAVAVEDAVMLKTEGPVS